MFLFRRSCYISFRFNPDKIFQFPQISDFFFRGLGKIFTNEVPERDICPSGAEVKEYLAQKFALVR